MQEVFERILSRIDNEQNGMKNNNEVYTMGEYEGLTIAKKIVEQEAEKYNNGWIPCSERLPENNQNVIACFAHGTVTTLQFFDNRFHGIYDYNKNAIAAWKPLPESYSPSGTRPKKTNFDRCCGSMEAMAQIIDIAKIGWTKDQIMAYLQSEAEE